MPSNAQQNIWKQMNYTPPRGSCNHKESLLSPKCPCLRFMLHPLKVRTIPNFCPPNPSTTSPPLTASLRNRCLANNNPPHLRLKSPNPFPLLGPAEPSPSSTSTTITMTQNHPSQIAPPNPPTQVTSSFTCDGCNHHASFHNMSSPTDDAIIARWTTEQSTDPPPAAPRSRKRPRRALIEAPPSVTNSAAPTEHEPADALDASFLFSEDVEWIDNGGRGAGASFNGSEAGGSTIGGGGARGMRDGGSRTWGDRFSSWSFGRAAAEEPVKTPPKRQQPGEKGRKKSARVSSSQRGRHQQRDEDEEGGSGVVDLD
ncbi:uncharacterized protein BKCO1_8900020 [Diplodia corticola]|uniref:Uncharacterized protein n=1 Tax=Diplodia corticola TaxID=236234 RepID=A0A1J9RKZ3_9PEZI|nr:uncharacterized protein BKCO1_8900020 [Diplodia corticola]OJD29183.1 hypothetical protein BKCO1_8900020 [Diplodia corticola]